MISQPQLLDFFVEVTDALVQDFDLSEFLHTLTGNAAAASDAAAVGLVLTDHHDRVRCMASSNEEGELLELVQIQNDEGPCLESIRTGWPVVNADLGEAGDRWPTFAPAARAAGFQSVHAFPMRLRDQTIGALNLFGHDRSRFDPGDVRVVQALADVASIAIIQTRSGLGEAEVSEQLRVALDDRVVIEQATGALAWAESLTPPHAFDLMRSTARSLDMKLVDLAHSVLLDVGASR